MNPQNDLFPEHAARARRDDPSTSHEAAATLNEAGLRASQHEVLHYLAIYGKAIDADLVGAVGNSQSASGVRTRRKELEAAGLVEPTGDVLKINGRGHRIFRVTDAGYAMLDRIGLYKGR